MDERVRRRARCSTCRSLPVARSRRCTWASTAPTSSGSSSGPMRDARRAAVAIRQPHQAGRRRAATGWSRSSRRTADVVVVDLPASELEAAGLACRAAPRAQPVADPRVDAAARGAAGPTADLPYDELLLWAWTGLAAQQPGATSDHPVAPVVPIITYEQGALGACAIAAALRRARQHAVAPLAHGVGTARGQRDEHVDPHRLPRHLPAVRRQQGRHRRRRRSSACTAAATACGCSCARSRRRSSSSCSKRST